MGVAMALWLFIGGAFSAVILLALWRGHNRTAPTLDDRIADPNEHGREADVLAADAARAADARLHLPRGGREVRDRPAAEGVSVATLVEQIKLADATPVLVRTTAESGFALTASLCTSA